MTEMININIIKNKKGLKLAFDFLKPSKENINKPYIVFLCGFKSDINGSKANFLHELCSKKGFGFLRFDYSGHGSSEGVFEELTISDWVSDSKFIIENVITKNKPIILVGSSMGGWIALKLLPYFDEIRKTAFLGIAPAPDFASKLMYERLEKKNKKSLDELGYIRLPFDNELGYYRLKKEFFDDADKNNILDDIIKYKGKTLIIHGMKDEDVPYSHALKICELIQSDDVKLILLKDSGHRLSDQNDLLTIKTSLYEIINSMSKLT